LFEQLGSTLARVQDQPKLAHECSASAVAALSAAQAIDRLKNSLDAKLLPPRIAAKGSRLLVRLSQTLHNPSAFKFGRRAAEAHALSRHALAADRDSAAPEETQALKGLIVGAATLGTDLIRARMVSKGESDAIPI
jgi:hypothetical protein